VNTFTGGEYIHRRRIHSPVEITFTGGEYISPEKNTFTGGKKIYN
jgi:hypothetical protein